ncbi:MAG: 5-methyltetrahydropteroyltriglutamate--homocysteine S-methyltransferase [Bifidobacteriaceae bacterium]|nr:5-methyltetrahydropteroyltriglutamate--homocysteine S-methyltransferase [Bifidobacteriaceae bacterium]
MLTSVVGYPRIGAKRELKFLVERYFGGAASEGELLAGARELRLEHWRAQRRAGIDLIPTGDFSFYDAMADTAVLFGAVPERYRRLGLSPLDTYFAMARGYQGPQGDVKALKMRKWFNTNYHYLVPEVPDAVRLSLSPTPTTWPEPLPPTRVSPPRGPREVSEGSGQSLGGGSPRGAREVSEGSGEGLWGGSRGAREVSEGSGQGLWGASSAPFDQFAEAKAAGISAKPVLIGPFTFAKLARWEGRGPAERAAELVEVYGAALARFGAAGASWVQLDEPALVMDLTASDVELLVALYEPLLAAKGAVKVLLQTYFGDIRDCYREVAGLELDGLGLDFVEGERTLELVRSGGLKPGVTLFAGLVNGKNVWRNDYEQSLATLAELATLVPELAVSTACSLLHVPYTVAPETGLTADQRAALAFAEEKLTELAELRRLAALPNASTDPAVGANAEARARHRAGFDAAVRARTEAITAADFTREPARGERAVAQREALGLGLLPTTTIGSFPQTAEVKANRARFRRGEIDRASYEARLAELTASCVALQEEIGLDVLVHGEFERGDMVEYFGENLDGFIFTRQAWVQSYGTRCVKPPIIWGDVKRRRPITVDVIRYAQSLTSRPVKAMLTGPVTILNWSFPRDDVPPAESAQQIALAIRDEVADLEAAGVRIIQIDEAALREKLPLRRADWHSGYLDWAIPAFRLVHSGVGAATQIHTHMCYSEFEDIIDAIDAMDADVISFEAARSSHSIVPALRAAGFATAVGPGVYDIHSPRVPAVAEIEQALRSILASLPAESVWVNPDCGLKTRGPAETEAALKNLVTAARAVRAAAVAA